MNLKKSDVLLLTPDPFMIITFQFYGGEYSVHFELFLEFILQPKKMRFTGV